MSAGETDVLALGLRFESLGFQCRKTDLLSWTFRVFCVTGIIGGDGRRAPWKWDHIWGLDVAHHQGLAF